MSTQPEVWLRGPLPGIPALLQPVAHALVQARDELNELMAGFPDDKLWDKVAGMASPAFHLQHLTGVLDRLFTYARNEALTEQQLDYLSKEGNAANKAYTTQGLVAAFNRQVDKALSQLSKADPASLTDFRAVGRGKLPSTVIGLYTHAAEHSMRHMGQLIVTVRVVSPLTP